MTRYLGAVVWLLPLALHLGWVCATCAALPPALGGTDRDIALAAWFAVVGMAGLGFLWLHLALPKFGPRMLAVPGHDYWHSTEERRAELVDRLRGICEVALLGLNVFFLAVYQSIYQTLVRHPLLVLPRHVLFGAFMALPVLGIVLWMIWTVRTLAVEAKRGLAIGEAPLAAARTNPTHQPSVPTPPTPPTPPDAT